MADLKMYSVSLVYQAQKGDRLVSALRASVVTAHSKEEALGMLASDVKAEMQAEGLSLLMDCVLEIPTNTTEE